MVFYLAGTAVITETEAALWTDGRYFLQAERQLDSNWTLMKDGRSFSAIFRFCNCRHYIIPLLLTLS